MTTAARELTETCPDCGQSMKGKSVSGAKSKLRAHQRQLHSASEPLNAATTAAAHEFLQEQGEAMTEAVEKHSETHAVVTPLPRVFDSGSGPAEGGADPEPEPPEAGAVPQDAPVRALDTKQLLDGLYGADKLGVLAWIHGQFGKPKNLFAAMHEVGLK